MPETPAELMVKSEPLTSIDEGTIGAKEALAAITKNNTVCVADHDILEKLQTWIIETRKNIEKEGK